ncbi:MAG: hypothetical protein LBL94_04955 [Prevotellaceae bacterium]|jgi:hypothetical protein|nr:hypothetical protein [Prevotellaceae bacterium]
MVQLEEYQLRSLLANAVECGVARYEKNRCSKADELSQRAAYQRFGASKVKQWVADGHIGQRKRDSSYSHAKIRYSYAELLSLEKAEKTCRLVNTVDKQTQRPKR